GGAHASLCAPDTLWRFRGRRRGGYRLRGDVIAELDRRIHLLERLDADADTTDEDVAVVEDAAEDRLIDVDAFDLVEMHLDGASANEAALVDDAPVGHRDLGGPAAKPGPEQPGGRHQQQGGGDPVPDADGADRHRPVAEPEDQRREDQEQQARHVDKPVKVGGVANMLTRLQHALHVAHGDDLRGGD